MSLWNGLGSRSCRRAERRERREEKKRGEGRRPTMIQGGRTRRFAFQAEKGRLTQRYQR